jgi:hypothetical protein
MRIAVQTMVRTEASRQHADQAPEQGDEGGGVERVLQAIGQGIESASRQVS